MRKIEIKRILHEALLNERLMDVNNDVNRIYDIYFKNDVDELEKTGVYTKTMFNMDKFDTSFLETPLGVKGHKLNPCIILINRGSNNYNPKQGKIGMSVNSNAVDYLRYDVNGVFEDALLRLPTRQAKSFRWEFSERKIKGSIHHELAHWLDDTLHNKHLDKYLDKRTDNHSKGNFNSPINAHYVEIQAQIHNIYQLKQNISDEWDSLTFDELLTKIPILSTVNKQLSGDIVKKWKRDLKTRMSREGLLGKNMR